jgi:putative transposase
MPRPLRPGGRGAKHHIFIRGVARSIIAVDAIDFSRALFLLERAAANYDLVCHAWSYLPNHSHLLVTTREDNVSKAMQWLYARTAEGFNQRHERSGHVFQGRFGSRLVEEDRHLLELSRYLPLNPVRAGLCRSPADWPWSSYAQTVGVRARPWFLKPDAFLGEFRSTDDYVDWVAQGVDFEYLDEHGARLPPPPTVPLATLLLEDSSDAGLARAHFEHGFSQTAIAQILDVNRSQICRRIARTSQRPL